MKLKLHLIIFLTTFLLISACSSGKVHADVDKALGKDTLKFVDTIMENYNQGIKISDISKKDAK